MTMKIEELISDNELLIWARDTWGSYGQHDNIYTFLLDLETLQSIPTYSLFSTRVENRDSRKNIHRKTFTSIVNLKRSILDNDFILKIVHDYESSSKRTITVTYYTYDESTDKFIELECKHLRDVNGYYDKIEYNNEIIIVRNNKIEVQK